MRCNSGGHQSGNHSSKNPVENCLRCDSSAPNRPTEQVISNAGRLRMMTYKVMFRYVATLSVLGLALLAPVFV